MKKTILIMIIFLGVLTNFLLPQDRQADENKITLKNIKKDSASPQEIYFKNEKQNKFAFLVRANYFSPTEGIFKTVYGSGISYGGEIIYSLWKKISISIGADYFSKTGEMTPLGEGTKINIIPVELGALYKFLKTRITPYAGAGVGYYFLSEESFLGKVKASNIGFFGKLGLAVYLADTFMIDINAQYNLCDATIDGITNNIGGIRIGMGIGLNF